MSQPISVQDRPLWWRIWQFSRTKSLDKSELVWWMVKHISWVRMWLRLWGMPIRQRRLQCTLTKKTEVCPKWEHFNVETSLPSSSTNPDFTHSSSPPSSNRPNDSNDGSLRKSFRKSEKNGRYELEQHDEQLGKYNKQLTKQTRVLSRKPFGKGMTWHLNIPPVIPSLPLVIPSLPLVILSEAKDLKT